MYNNENLLKIESDSMTGNIGSGITLRSQENRTAYWFQTATHYRLCFGTNLQTLVNTVDRQLDVDCDYMSSSKEVEKSDFWFDVSPTTTTTL